MILSESSQQQLLQLFPKFELSYESIVHKKVYNSDIVMAIPEGKKCFMWFTTHLSQNVCVLLEQTENHRISKISFAQTCFSSELSFGTILHGTLYRHNGTNYFSSEDIYYYKGRKLTNKEKNYDSKLRIFCQMFKNHIKQVAYSNNHVVIGLPIMGRSMTDIQSIVDLLPYKIRYIQHRYTQHSDNYNIINVLYVKNSNYTQPVYYNKDNVIVNNYKRELVFKVKPDVQNDIYYLYYYHNGTTDNMYDVAFIPDYVTSVMMNKLFRNIKENANLDALEESDDEEEFEDNRIDKYVYLDKTYNMTCIYNVKFKKWTPVRMAGKGVRIVNKKELFHSEK
jgi:hypothetical protein